jgi:hypothetical protein
MDDVSGLDGFERFQASRKVRTEMGQTAGSRADDNDGDSTARQILLKPEDRIQRDEHIKFRLGKRQELPILLS